ncbi:hypothetical protein BVC80_9077g111 [Macleaya cordata]|uniref:Autophagy-related protein 27 n=1 Tax=Macleaya cordata TaxID=56857 RepID=A0A200PLU2_MACCD|nr:hypothetical protein BVC80_9077g111 [Macleaya cordata]
MAIRDDFLKLVLFLTILHRVESNPISAVCDLSVLHDNKLYNFSLDSPTPNHPHGVLSEDGFYKIAVNKTVLWFQLCDGMIFNHNPPRCFDCLDCGGPSRCGMECSALASNYLGGYNVCTTIGRAWSTQISLIDKEKPQMGVAVKMSSNGLKVNCSLSITVYCDANGVQGPDSLADTGTCDYAAVLRHPSGCAKIISVHGSGWGWLGTLGLILLCLFGGYLLAGTVYRFFALGIRGIEVIPNLEFWLSIPHRTQRLGKVQEPHLGTIALGKS